MRIRDVFVVGVLWVVAMMPGRSSHAEVPHDGAQSGSTRSATHDPRLLDPMTDATQNAQGLYLSGPMVRALGLDGIIREVRSARMNAVVIDMKDGDGRVTYDTRIPILEENQRNFLGDARALLAGLEEAGIYTIARITCFADKALPHQHPELAIMDSRERRTGPWRSWGTGGSWLDPYNRANHDIMLELAREAEDMGFDEIQLDYIRFPVDDGTQFAVYPAEDGTERPALLIELLRRIDLAVHIPLGVDVFGLAAYRDGDPSGLGQDLEKWQDYVEVYSPMLYLNAMRSWEVGKPHRGELLVRAGVQRLRERLGPRPVLRPYLQAFEVGADYFNAQFIVEQIRGTRNAGGDGFLFWHPGSRYSMLRRGMRALGPLGNFPNDERAEARRRHAERVQARAAH